MKSVAKASSRLGELDNIAVLNPHGPHHARIAIRARELAYIAEPSVDNARDLVLSVQAYWRHLEAMGVRCSTTDAFLDMNAMAEAEDVLRLCAKAILRALRLARRYTHG